MLKRLQQDTERAPIGLRYGLALICSAALIALTVYWNSKFSHTRYLFCFIAVVLSSAYGGFGPGLLSIVLCLFGLNNYILPMLESSGLFFDEAIPGIIFTLVSLFISGLVEHRRKAQQDLLTITNAMPAGIAYIDKDFRYRFGNKIYYTRYALTPEQLYGKSVEEVLGQEAYESALPSMKRVLNGENVQVEVLTRFKDGRPLMLNAAFVPAPRVRGVIPGFYVLSVDITQRKEMEIKLRQTEDRQRRAIVAGKVGLWEWDFATGHVEWSDQIYNFYGLKRGEFDGTVKMFADLTYPEDRARVMDRLQHAIDGQAIYDMEMRIVRPDGDLRWIWTTGDFQRDDSGKPLQMRGATVDITERKRWEESLSTMNEKLEKDVAARVEQLRKKEEELFQVRKLEAIGQLAGGVAHDFNNLMTGIIGITESLHESLDANDPRREDTEAIIKAAERTTELTRQLLAFGRRQIANAKIIDLNSGVKDSVKLLGRLIREDIQMDLKLGEPMSIKIDLTQLQQILINLVVNARDAMPKGGTVTLATSRRGQRALLMVSDTGTGMVPEVLQHLFEPFYTTKDVNKGTGLGLATVYGIVKQNGGDVEVQSTRGVGSTFQIYFPIVDAAVSVDPAPKKTIRDGGGESVLLVEDEDIVRRVIARKLREAGYSVITAENGEEALKSAIEKKPDLVVTDVIMPGMNGPEVVGKIRELHPEIAVLYMSGYPEDVIAHSGVLEPGIDFLEKPIVAQQLTEKVRAVLDKVQKKR